MDLKLILGVVIVVILLYIIWSYFFTSMEVLMSFQKGTELFHKSLDKVVDNSRNNYSFSVWTYIDDWSVNYGVSTWLYIHPVPTNTNEAYVQNTSLINCGNVPDILFNAEKGVLIFSVDVTSTNGGKRTVIVPDKKTKRDVKIIYSRWNNVFVNFIDGGMDIFLNGDLVISQPNIIPHQNPNGVIIGSLPGIYGEMSNLVYYKTPVLAQNIKLMYDSMKDMNPPVTV